MSTPANGLQPGHGWAAAPGPRPGSGRARPHPALLAAAATYLVLRALVLHTNFDDVALPAYELFPSGTLARNLLGPRSDLRLLYCYDNSLGPPLISYLTAASFWLFGPSYLALKLVAFAVMFPCLFLIWSFLRRHFGTTAAGLGALLFALPPTTLFQYTLLPIGNHAENVTLTMLATWAFLRVHASARPLRDLFLAGLAGGFALSIFLGALVPVALLLALHAGLVGPRRALRELPVALLGLALGLAPLVAANTLAGGARGLSFLGEKFKGSAGEAFDWSLFGQRLEQFFTVHLPRAGTARDWLGMPGGLADGLFLGAFLLALALSLPRALRGLGELARGLLGEGALARGDAGTLGRALLVPLFALLPLTALAFALSDLRMGDHAYPLESAGYRYFLPHFLFALLLISLTAARLWAHPGPRRWIGALLAGAALFAGAFDLDLVDLASERKGAGARYEGYNVKQTARNLFLPSNALDTPAIVRIAESYPPRFRAQVYFGLGFYEPYRRNLQAFPPDLEPAELLAAYPPERRADMARGIGTLMRHRQSGPAELPAEAWTALSRYAAAGEPLGQQVAEGLCTRWSPLLSFDTAAHVQENLALTARARERVPALADAVARGFGLDAGRLVRRGLPYEQGLVRGALARLPAPSLEPFLRGLGLGLADGGERPAIPERVADWVEGEQVELVLAGFAGRLVEILGPVAGARALERAPRPEAWVGR